MTATNQSETAWTSGQPENAILDSEWPLLRDAFERWLDPANFSGDARQRTSLSVLTAEARKALADG